MAKVIDFNQFQRLMKEMPKQVNREFLREMGTTSSRIKNDYNRNVKDNFDKGDLQNSIISDSAGLVWEVGSTVKHSVFIEFGTKPHLIVAKSGFLHFYWPKIGQWVRPIAVSHPGTRAYLPLTQAWLDNLSGDQIYRRIKKRLDRLGR
jgi:hypothetical protein